MSEITTENEENKRLISLAKEGDMLAFEELIRQHEKIVYNVAFRMLNHSEDAKDISQEVFIKAYRNLPQFDGRSSFSTWLYRITMNTCIDEVRKRKGKATISLDDEQESDSGNWKQQYADESDTPEESVIRQEGKSEIMQALDKLSEEHKKVIVLRDIQGMSYDEIAEITDLSLGTVKSRISRARIQLKQEIIKIRERNETNVRQNSMKGG